MAVYKLKNGFKVHKLLQAIHVDYLFSKSDAEDFYRLLNIDAFGHIENSNVDMLKKTKRVIVINNDSLEMKAFNIDDSEILTAMMELN